jgi:hypothetical protein
MSVGLGLHTEDGMIGGANSLSKGNRRCDTLHVLQPDMLVAGPRKMGFA